MIIKIESMGVINDVDFSNIYNIWYKDKVITKHINNFNKYEHRYYSEHGVCKSS